MSPTNPRLYEAVKREAKSRFARWPSAYASAWLSREYRKRGGSYKGKKRSAGVDRWMREEWVQVVPYLTDGTRVACGARRDAKACRPMRRVSSATPLTLPELVKMHGKGKLLALAKRKRADMDGRVDWKRATFGSRRPSKKSKA